MDVQIRPIGRVIGAVLGGALGDALGAHVEFMTWSEIQSKFGPDGITSLERTYGRIGAITDDTQLTAFSLEAAIRWSVARRNGDAVGFDLACWRAYQRWLLTQDASGPELEGDGWLLSRPWLHHRRAPGNTNLQSLRSGVMGRVIAPTNDSYGCGGVMRSAPLGFFAADANDAFRKGVDSAVVTHGDPRGYLPAGALSAAIYLIANGRTPELALEQATVLATEWPDSESTVAVLRKGLDLGRAGLPSPTQIREIGEGWKGHEALAIAAACVIAEVPVWQALCVAANHDGDSDSTASVAGQLLGAYYGVRGLPQEWLAQLEGSADLTELCQDFVAELSGETAPPDASVGSPWWLKYPGVRRF